MPRLIRIELAGGIFHIISRGDRCEDIYLDDADRKLWFSIFGDVCRRFNWICHSYCLMDNHYHLILETPLANLSNGMRQLNCVYAQAFNRRHGLAGHLFQGRFKSILVEKDYYLLELTRYIPLNPVRAKITETAEEWPWSSYRSTIGITPSPWWLETDWTLRLFHKDLNRARKLFIDFVRAGIGLPSVWEELSSGTVLGSDEYIDEVSREVESTGAVRAIRRSHKREKQLWKYEWDATTRNDVMIKAYLSGGHTMTEIAQHLRVHQSTVSRVVKQYEKTQRKE